MKGFRQRGRFSGLKAALRPERCADAPGANGHCLWSAALMPQGRGIGGSVSDWMKGFRQRGRFSGLNAALHPERRADATSRFGSGKPKQ